MIRTRLTTTVCAVIALGTALTTSHAQMGYGPQQGNWELTLQGNGSSANDFDAGSFSTGLSLGYFLTEQVELGIRQNFFFADFGRSSWNAGTRAFLDYHFDLDRWQPYVGANFGGFYGNGVNDTWAAGLEGGIKYYVKQQTFVFAGLEYQWLFDRPTRANNTFDDGQFVYGLGIGFNF